MTGKASTKNGSRVAELAVNKDEFDLYGQDDFLRVDNLCKGVLLRFYEQLQEEGLTPEEATILANGADYFIRNFVVDFKALNLFDEFPGIVRQFAGNWYIANTLDPEIGQLGRYLDGISAFYRFLHSHGFISSNYLRVIEKECDDLDYYERRIASFWEIEGDGYDAWERGCTLKDEGTGQGRA